MREKASEKKRSCVDSDEFGKFQKCIENQMMNSSIQQISEWANDSNETYFIVHYANFQVMEKISNQDN